MTDDDRAWVKTLPLLLTASILLLAGAFMFWKQGNSVLSNAAAAVGVFLLGSWAATAIADWSKHHRHRQDGTQ